jgi:hypothetical protein
MPGKVFEKPIQKKSIKQMAVNNSTRKPKHLSEINDGTKTKEKMKNNLCNLIKSKLKLIRKIKGFERD